MYWCFVSYFSLFCYCYVFSYFALLHIIVVLYIRSVEFQDRGNSGSSQRFTHCVGDGSNYNSEASFKKWCVLDLDRVSMSAGSGGENLLINVSAVDVCKEGVGWADNSLVETWCTKWSLFPNYTWPEWTQKGRAQGLKELLKGRRDKASTFTFFDPGWQVILKSNWVRNKKKNALPTCKYSWIHWPMLPLP